MKQVPLRNSEIQILDKKWQRPTHLNDPENGDIPVREFIFWLQEKSLGRLQFSL